MVKITVDLIEQCAQYTNAVKEREIDLRGYKISVIENMGATLVSILSWPSYRPLVWLPAILEASQFHDSETSLNLKRDL